MTYFNRLFCSLLFTPFLVVHNCLCFIFVYASIWASPLMCFHSFLSFGCSAILNVSAELRITIGNVVCKFRRERITAPNWRRWRRRRRRRLYTKFGMLDMRIIGLCAVVCMRIAFCLQNVCVSFLRRNHSYFIDMNGKSLAVAAHKLTLVFIGVHVG